MTPNAHSYVLSTQRYVVEIIELLSLDDVGACLKQRGCNRRDNAWTIVARQRQMIRGETRIGGRLACPASRWPPHVHYTTLTR
jgi:hypothetical protein